MNNQEPCMAWRRPQLLMLTAAVGGGVWLALGVAGQARAAEPATGLAELTRLEETFAAVAEKAFPAVVVITNKQAVGRSRLPGGYQELPPELRRFFGIPDEDAVAGDEEDATVAPPRRHGGALRPVGKGSGVLFRDTGYVVTNCHVIADADALEVKLHDGRVFDNARQPREVEVVGVDPETDLAVLRLGDGKLKGLPTLPFADSAKVKVGQFAIAVGAPFNFDYSLSVGHVSQQGRHDMNVNRYENYIQTDASINPGNSGGPLLNIRGEVIGINEFIVNGGAGAGNVGFGFAIASNLVRQVAEGLAANHGKVPRPWLGITMQSLTPELRRQFKTGAGVVVNNVVRGDPAAQGGMRPGDVIVTVGDTPVRTPHDVQFAILNYHPGDRIPMMVNRQGKVMRLAVVARQKGGDGERTVAPAPAAEKSGVAGQPLRRLHRVGISLEDTRDGVMVVAVRPGSLAAQAQLRRGDRILEINQQPVRSVAEANAALVEAGDEVVLYIARRESKFFVPLAASGDTDG